MRREMRMAAAGAVCLGVTATEQAQASPPGPRDYFLDPPAAGLWAHLDAFTIGAQAALEHRYEIDGDLTMLTTRVNSMAALGFGDLGAHVDFRVALLTVGGSAGYRQVWRHYPVPAGQPSTIDRRLAIDRDEDPVKRGNVGWPWAEGRVRLVIPLERLWLVTNGIMRWEDAPPNSYDWVQTNIHDGGTMLRADATLFVRHERYGAVGPTVRYMSLPRDGKKVDELAVGFTLGTRPGWRRKADLFLLQFLTVPGSDEFGFHVLRSPIYALLIYRVSIGLSVPPRAY